MATTKPQVYVERRLRGGELLTIIQPEQSHVEPLMFNLRRGDRIEVMRFCEGLGPEIMQVRDKVRNSLYGRTALIDGQVAAMWGVTSRSVITQRGEPWCLTTHLIDRHKRVFLVCSRIYLEQMQAMFPTLEVLIDAEYTAACRWARWMGFTLTPTKYNGHDFYMAVITAEQVA